MDPREARQRLVELAGAEGFPLVRFAAAGVLREARAAAQERRAAGMFADMSWMTEEWVDRATDTERFLAGTRTVMVVGLPYGAEPDAEPCGGPARGRIARYARGRDYHRVFEKKLRRLAGAVREQLGARARATVDYGPLLERPFAAASGMGWLGKSTMLLVPGFGPWVLLGVLATDLEAEPDAPLAKSCGSCTRCIAACPTGAISPDGNVVDARLCISYHTIENRGPIPRELRAQFGDWIFGCDACLESCPVGRHAGPGAEELRPVSPGEGRPELAPLLALDEAAFTERYRGRPIMRAKRDGFLRNVCVALGNVGTGRDVAALIRALDDPSALIRGHAAWALGRMAERGVLDGEALARVNAT
ncbi:MAG: tRNA epoxyqueuosine(34) reductase QueG, partial [Hyphomicrobiales bacterium]